MKDISKTSRQFKFWPLSIVIFFTILVAIGYIIHTSLLCDKYKCLVFPDKENWQVIETYEDTGKSWRGLLSSKSGYQVRLYKVSGVSREQADEFTNTSTMQAKGLFDNARSPYPGEISDEIECDKDNAFLEKQKRSDLGTDIKLNTSYLNDRMQYGVCLDNQITSKVFMGMFYCANTTEWYQIEVIVPLGVFTIDGNYESLFSTVGCQRPSLNIGRLFP